MQSRHIRYIKTKISSHHTFWLLYSIDSATAPKVNVHVVISFLVFFSRKQNSVLEIYNIVQSFSFT